MPDSTLLPGALDGRTVVVAGGAGAVARRCADLGAGVLELAAPDLLDEQTVAVAAAAVAGADLLAVDAAAGFAAAGGGLDGLRVAVDGAWNAVRAVANAAWIAPERPGRIVLLAPPPGAGDHAGAVRAALENTARTLSTEWAHYTITPTAILPGDATTGAETAELVAFIASEAGAYYTGCAFTLGAA